MKSYGQFIVESSKMAVSDAEKLLGLFGQEYDADTLNSVARSHLQRSHPDKGGTSEDFIRAKAAFDTLKKYVKDGKVKSSTHWYQDKIKVAREWVVEEIKDKLDIDKFSKYFSDVFGEPFNAELHEFVSRYAGNYASFSAKWENVDKKKRFDLSISVDLHSIAFGPKKLSGGDDDSFDMDKVDYSFTVYGYGYSDNRKIKITQNNYIRSDSYKVLTDPRVAFPKAKITKKQTRKFAKRDMELVLREINTKWATDMAFIPIATSGAFLGIRRNTLMGIAAWTCYGIYKHTGISFKTTKHLSTVSLPETEDTAEWFRDASKANEQQLEIMVSDKRTELYGR